MCETLVSRGHELVVTSDDLDSPGSSHHADNMLNVTNSSGCCELDVDYDSSDDGYAMRPRKLDFDNSMELSDDDGEPTTAAEQDRTPSATLTGPMGRQKDGVACSPPYKKVRALRLFDTPATPKTLIKKAAMHTPIPNKGTRLFHQDKPKAMATAYPHHQHQAVNNLKNGDAKPQANINPFTPNGMLLARKRTRSKRSLIGSPELRIPKFDLADSDESDEEVEQPTKRVALHDSNISRYYQEFLELELLGKGQFGSVYKCTHRLDGCNYAVKKSIKPVAGSVSEKNALNEVYAHAVLGKHQHVVRYYSAWAEDDHMIIQNEYCNGGSLADAIAKNREAQRHFSETELRRLLLHIAKGLGYIHSMKLVHMDIKPDNIFIAREKGQMRLNYESADDGYEEEEETEEEVTYKIGDLGHVTLMNNPQIEEGDCRYLPNEVLQEECDQLTKADIFALGLTVYEAAGGGPLPQNGPEWHEIRKGNLDLESLTNKETKRLRYSNEFIDLLKQMIHPNPEVRPSAGDLIHHRVLSPSGSKSKAELERELQAERVKNELLVKQLQEATKCLQTIAPNVVGLNGIAAPEPVATTGYRLRPTPTRTSRVIGRKTNRSISTTNF